LKKGGLNPLPWKERTMLEIGKTLYRTRGRARKGLQSIQKRFSKKDRDILEKGAQNEKGQKVSYEKRAKRMRPEGDKEGGRKLRREKKRSSAWT